MTRTPALDVFYPTKSLPFSIIWEDNTDPVVDLHRLQLCMRNFEQGLHKAPLEAVPQARWHPAELHPLLPQPLIPHRHTDPKHLQPLLLR